MTFLFGSPSVWQAIVLAKRLRRTSTVYVLEETVRAPLEFRQARRRLFERWLRWLNPACDIRGVPAELSWRQLWTLNAESLQDLDAAEGILKGSAAFRMGLAVLQEGHVLNYYQMCLAHRLPRRRLLFHIGQALSSQHPGLQVVPDGCYRGELVLETAGVLLCAVNRLRRVLRRAVNLACLAMLPAGSVVLWLRRFAWAVARPRYDVKIPVVHGFGPDSRFGGLRRLQDDGELYGEALRPGQAVHVFDHWMFPAEVRRAFQRAMDARNIPWVEADAFRMDLRLLRRLLRYQAVVLKRLLTDPALWAEDNDLLEATVQLLRDCLHQERERANLDYRVEVIRNDYNPSHVVATVMAHRHRGRTVGVQHAAAPWDLPQLAYVHLDHYVVFGELFVRSFGRHWTSLNLEKAGRHNIDWIVELSHDPAKIQAIAARVEARYGPRRPRILLLLPSTGAWVSRAQWDQLYHGLSRLGETGFGGLVILRCRSARDLGDRCLARFTALAARDPRIVIESSTLTTHELMVVSDAVIGSSGSFALCEAVQANVKVFSFEFLGTGRRYYGDYGTEIVLETAEDLLRLFERLGRGDTQFDCDWDRLRRDCSYHADGENSRRIQQVVLRALANGAASEPAALQPVSAA